MKPSMLFSRTSALLEGLSHEPGTSAWVLCRLLSSSRISPQDLTSAPIGQLDVQQVLLNWAELAPDWPLSENQVSSLTTLLSSPLAPQADLGPVLVRLAQEEKWAALSSLVSSLDDPTASLSSARYLFENHPTPLPDSAIHMVRLMAIKTASGLLLHLDERVGPNPHYQGVPDPSAIEAAWQSSHVSQALSVLSHCLDFMRPTGQYGSRLLSQLRDLSHHCSLAIKHNPAPRAALSASSIIERFHPDFQANPKQASFQPS